MIFLFLQYSLHLHHFLLNFISSHILSELYAVATKFCIIEKGKVIKELTKEELDLECSKCIVIKTDNVKKAATVLEKELKTTNYFKFTSLSASSICFSSIIPFCIA